VLFVLAGYKALFIYVYYKLFIIKGGSVLLVVGLFNANSPVIDILAACIVIIYKCINVLDKGLHGVLHVVLYNACPPNVAGWC